MILCKILECLKTVSLKKVHPSSAMTSFNNSSIAMLQTHFCLPALILTRDSLDIALSTIVYSFKVCQINFQEES